VVIKIGHPHLNKFYNVYLKCNCSCVCVFSICQIIICFSLHLKTTATPKLKSPTGVNLFNVKRPRFSYERLFGSFSSSMHILKLLKRMFVQKICMFNVDEIDYRCPMCTFVASDGAIIGNLN